MRVRLGELSKGSQGRILEVIETPDAPGMGGRLLEMGLLDGAWVEVVHEAPISADPIIVKVRGTLLALRRNEANHVWVEYV